MKMPWADRTGLAKATAFLTTCLIVSTGLCGINFVAFIKFVPMCSPGPQPGMPPPAQWPAAVLTTTGLIELIGISGSLVGLIVIATISIYRVISRRSFQPTDEDTE